MAINGSGGLGEGYGVPIGPNEPIRDSLHIWVDNRYKDFSTGTWQDVSGNSNNLTEVNAEDSDWKGWYWDIDGSNEYFRRTSGASPGNANWSVEIWALRDSIAVSSTDYYADGRAPDDTNDWYWLSSSSTDTNLSGRVSGNWSDGHVNWHQIVATMSSTSTNGAKTYINGEFFGQGTGAITWNSGYFTLGARYSATGPWDGRLGCCRVYHKTLSAEEVYHNFLVDASKFQVESVGKGL